jgi:hypothetical protein
MISTHLLRWLIAPVPSVSGFVSTPEHIFDESFNYIALQATYRSFAFRWGLLPWQASWIAGFPYRLNRINQFSRK